VTTDKGWSERAAVSDQYWELETVAVHGSELVEELEQCFELEMAAVRRSAAVAM